MKSQGMQALASIGTVGSVATGISLLVAIAENEELRREGKQPETAKAVLLGAAFAFSAGALFIGAMFD